MDLKKLFEIQAGLDLHISKEHPVKEGENRLAKKILALQVELGECANEWRGFKFWSNDQKPKLNGFRATNLGIVETKPLLEEYVDCLHFILSIGLDLDVSVNIGWDDICHYDNDITSIFLNLNNRILELRHWENDESWVDLFEEFYILGKMLGFTWEQIEAGYLEKNRINHERQVTGY